MTLENQEQSSQNSSKENTSESVTYVNVGCQQGWQCPVCSSVWAPFVSGCLRCNSLQDYFHPTWPSSPDITITPVPSPYRDPDWTVTTVYLGQTS